MPTALCNFSINLTASQIQRNSLQRQDPRYIAEALQRSTQKHAVLYRTKNTGLEAMRLGFCTPAWLPFCCMTLAKLFGFSGYKFLPL